MHTVIMFLAWSWLGGAGCEVSGMYLLDRMFSFLMVLGSMGTSWHAVSFLQGAMSRVSKIGVSVFMAQQGFFWKEDWNLWFS